MGLSSETWWVVKAHLSERDCRLGSHLCQQGDCSQEHELFLNSFLGLDFLIAGDVDHPVGAIPHVFVCCWKTSSPKTLLS